MVCQGSNLFKKQHQNTRLLALSINLVVKEQSLLINDNKCYWDHKLYDQFRIQIIEFNLKPLTFGNWIFERLN